jgi:hypothetical protein
MKLLLTTTKADAARGAMAYSRAWTTAQFVGMVFQRNPARGQEENR